MWGSAVSQGDGPLMPLRTAALLKLLLTNVFFHQADVKQSCLCLSVGRSNSSF